MRKPVPTNTRAAIKAISAEMSIEEEAIELIIDSFLRKIRDCLRAEIPFTMRDVGKFYHKYMQMSPHNPFLKHPDRYVGKVWRHLVFSPCGVFKDEFHGWVDDLGIKNNRPKEMIRLRIKPTEIEKIRRKKIMEEQRAIGFKSDLLFDDDQIPASDKLLGPQLSKAPTVEEILRKVGALLDK